MYSPLVTLHTYVKLRTVTTYCMYDHRCWNLKLGAWEHP